MGGHPQRQVGERPERGKVGRLEGRAVGLDDRQRAVAVGGGAAVTGDVLEHRQHAAGRAGLRPPRAAIAATLLGVLP